MRRSIGFIAVLLLVIWAGSAFAQVGTPTPPGAPTPAPAGGSSIDWSSLDPGNDWAASVINSVFPVNGAPPTSTGHEATVIGVMLGQLTALVSMIALFFVSYATIMNIHRVAETANILTRGMNSMFLVRMGMAAALMYPLPSGFSAGQGLVVQTAMYGIGMARAIYANAVQAIGPDAMTIATPIIPGTKTIVLNLMQDELCAALVNQAANNANLVPTPSPISGTDASGGGYITWSYSLSAGNETGAPVCGTVTVRQANGANASIAGVSTDMTAAQQTVLTNVLTNDIRPAVQTVAQNFWMTKQVSSLVPLQGLLTSATSDYTSQLTTQASTIVSQLRAALADPTNARNGDVGLPSGETELSSLGWTAAGAYYLEFARLNGQTLSLMSATPTFNAPSYDGLGASLGSDLAPMIQSSNVFLIKLATYVSTSDGATAPAGNADLFSSPTPGQNGAGTIEQLFRSLGLTESGFLSVALSHLSPTNTQWTDPFGALVSLGNWMIATSMAMLGTASILASGTGSTLLGIVNAASGDAPGVIATLIGHLAMQFLAGPVFFGCMALLIPGLTLAFVLPMIPWVMWMAGVCGYLILVCEAVIAVPLWMLAHMTFEGDGLHGRATEGYSLLFNVLFRPTLMLLGLFLGYFIFDSMAWLINQSFGVAAGFVLANGWIVTNVLGMIVLLAIFVMTHVVVALKSFQMIALVPHHLPRLIGFTSASRVDIEQFSRDAATVGVGGALKTIDDSVQIKALEKASLPANKGGSAGGKGGTHSTLNATTELAGPSMEE